MNTPAAKPRQYYIDWLRVIAIFLVFVYHSLRPFGSEYFHVMNGRPYAANTEGRHQVGQQLASHRPGRHTETGHASGNESHPCP